ncbi:MAG: hypothetical protein V8S95_01980 [Odoribacter sp.]
MNYIDHVLLGDNMSPSVRQMFTDPATGTVDKDRARLYIKQVVEDKGLTPQKLYWLNMEEQTLATRKMAKYNDLLMKALYITDEQAKIKHRSKCFKSRYQLYR